jgi:hypothetical protein
VKVSATNVSGGSPAKINATSLRLSRHVLPDPAEAVINK